jgi:hypothetical protein
MSKKTKPLTIDESKQILRSCYKGRDIPIEDHEDPIEARIYKEKSHIKCLAAMFNIYPNHKYIVFDSVFEENPENLSDFLNLSGASRADFFTHLSNRFKTKKINFKGMLEHSNHFGEDINDEIVSMYFNNDQIDRKKFVQNVIHNLHGHSFEYLLEIIGNDAKMIYFILKQKLTTEQRVSIFVNYIRDEYVPVLNLLPKYKTDEILNNEKTFRQSRYTHYSTDTKSVRKIIEKLYRENENYEEVINKKPDIIDYF